MKRVILSMLFIALLVLSTGCAQILERYYEPVDPESEEEVLFTVPSGATTTSIATALHEANLIQNINAFKLNVKQLEVDGKMKAGDYKLSKAMRSDEIIMKLVNGDVFVETVTFTIPEGYEVRQIIDKLEAEGIIDRDAFIGVLENEPFDYAFLKGVDRSKRLEGYLFPDTYTVKKGADEKAIVNKMLARFDEVWKDEYDARAKELDMTIDEVVRLASIIEREARIKSEFATVSSVFHNRLEIGMLLQSCATVQFILQERKEVLLYEDIEIDNPYNTYLYAGLPPSPIASPGELAIKSALYPEETKYLYFVTTEKNDGSHYFNETLAGHNRDIEKGK